MVYVEIVAGTGFLWLLLDSEHAPHDLCALLGGLQTLAPYPVQGIAPSRLDAAIQLIVAGV